MAARQPGGSQQRRNVHANHSLHSLPAYCGRAFGVSYYEMAIMHILHQKRLTIV